MKKIIIAFNLIALTHLSIKAAQKEDFATKLNPENPITTRLNRAISGLDENEIKNILKESPYIIDVLDKRGNAPLHHVLNAPGDIPIFAYGIDRMVSILLSACANPNIKNSLGDTPLITAAKYGHPKAIELLIHANALVDEKNNQGTTALMQAVRNNQSTAKEMVEILLDAGANPELKNNVGISSLEMAKQLKEPYIYKAMNKSILEKQKRRKLEQEKLILKELRFQPNSLEMQIFNLAKAKRYDEIFNLIEKTTDLNELKKLVLMQLSLAKYLASRIRFDIGDESQIFQHSLRFPTARDPIRAQWIFLIRQAMLDLADKQINNQNLLEAFKRPLALINDFLFDLGSLKYVQAFNKTTAIRSVIAQNFKELFERFSYIMLRNPAR